MNKVIIIGEKGNQTSIRDEDTQDAINLYCKSKNITKSEVNVEELSIYTVEFNSDNQPLVLSTGVYIHLINGIDE